MHPLKIEKTDIVIIKKSKKVKEATPWIGRVKKLSKSQVTYDWIVKSENGTGEWEEHGWDSCQRKPILAKIKNYLWDGRGKMPDELDFYLSSL